MKKQGFNPYLPSWEYIPDGEPHVFDGRVYVFGSHDRFGGHTYCPNDYVCWSAPVEDLADWRCEGVIYGRTDDPANRDGDMLLFAPDVTRGPDGRYYLYYVLDQLSVISVAVCDSPAGRYRFYGYVRHADGTRYGEKAGDAPQFDPGVLVENDAVYLYTGFCPPADESRRGSMVTVLEPDMLTVRSAPAIVVPSAPYAAGTSFAEFPFFEASSIRKVGERYYFIYSTIYHHELSYAVSDSPLGPFAYGGVIVSNADVHIDTYKPADQPMFYGGNNHGCLEQINGQWYIFYHRHTNGTNFSRQGCLEPVTILPDGKIPQVEMTSCGGNGGPLAGYGTYPAHIACNLFCRHTEVTTGAPGDWMDCRFPRITQDEPDGETGFAHIANLRDGAAVGFKYFDCRGIRRASVTVRGSAGVMQVRTRWDGEPVGEIPLNQRNEWTVFSAEVSVPDGVQALYFTYRGPGISNLAFFSLGGSDTSACGERSQTYKEA